MEKIIIWGTGDWGAQAYYNYHEEYEVLFFVDSNEKLWGTEQEYLGCLNVYPPEKIKEFPEAKIMVAVKSSEQIAGVLKTWGRDYILHVDEFQRSQKCMLRNLYENKAIDLGKLLYRAGELNICQSFAWGSSETMDYLFVCAIAKLYDCRKYLEIGTFIGDSIRSASYICEECHSVTAAPDSEYSMAEFCKKNDIPDYSDRLANIPGIIHHYGDSKKFDFSDLGREIDLFFVDGDHTCLGVYNDTKNIFRYKKKDAFVIWHDFKSADYENGGTISSAIRLAIGDEEFQNVYAVDKNICGIYIPPKYQSDFSLGRVRWTVQKQDLYYYDLIVNPKIDKA